MRKINNYNKNKISQKINNKFNKVLSQINNFKIFISKIIILNKMLNKNMK